MDPRPAPRTRSRLQEQLGIPDSFWLGKIQVDLTRELGRGADASVHETDFHGLKVAVKVLHSILLEPSQGRDGEGGFIHRFGQECLTLQGLSHENVCTVLGVGSAPNNSPCLVMEWMPYTLAKRRDMTGRDADTLVDYTSYFVDIATGLRYLHWRKVIHRDLKPENVLVKGKSARIADVGLAKWLVHRDQQNTRGVGTPSYMAPEVALGMQYGFPADIFSFGVLMLSVLLKHDPHMEGAHLQPASNNQFIRIPEATRRARDIAELPSDHPLRRLILVCIKDEPDERPNAEQVHRQLVAAHAKMLREQEEQQQADVRQPSNENSSDILAAIRREFGATLQEIQRQVTAVASSVTVVHNDVESLQRDVHDVRQQLDTVCQETSLISTNVLEMRGIEEEVVPSHPEGYPQHAGTRLHPPMCQAGDVHSSQRWHGYSTPAAATQYTPGHYNPTMHENNQPGVVRANSSGDEPAVMSCGPGSQRPYQSSVTATTRSWHGDPAVTWSNQPNAGTIVFANPHGSMQFNMPR